MNTEKQANKKEKWAIISVSSKGAYLSKKIQLLFPDEDIDLYTLEKYAITGIKSIKNRLKDEMAYYFREYTTLVCIMAAGIAVRSIAPYLVHKSKDPGVIVIDELGLHTISLLSGHLGNANVTAEMIAEALGSRPVITTASDVNRSIAVDTLAQKLGCVLTEFEKAKNITVKILEGKNIAFYSDEPVDMTGISLPSNIKIIHNLSEAEVCEGLIYCSKQTTTKYKGVETVRIIPENIIVGIGCRKGKSSELIADVIENTFNTLKIKPESIKTFATIKLKAKEKGILDIVCKYNSRLQIIEKEEIIMVQKQFVGSDFVEKTTGMRAVAEPCGYIASGYGTQLTQRIAIDGITLSIWEEKT
jgi:cobalt-precorrin 5A hydrolase